MTINENTLAKQICEREGGAVNMNIGQVKECLRCTLDILGEHRMSSVVALVEKHAKVGGELGGRR